MLLPDWLEALQDDGSPHFTCHHDAARACTFHQGGMASKPHFSEVQIYVPIQLYRFSCPDGQRHLEPRRNTLKSEGLLSPHTTLNAVLL